MNNKSIREIILATAMFGGLSQHNNVFARDEYGNPDSIAPSAPKKIIPAGCKEYSFYGHTVIAISEKSARKKCRKLYEKHYQNKEK